MRSFNLSYEKKIACVKGIVEGSISPIPKGKKVSDTTDFYPKR